MEVGGPEYRKFHKFEAEVLIVGVKGKCVICHLELNY